MDTEGSAAIDDALARAVVYRTTSLALQPPSEDRLHQMGAQEGFGPVLAAARLVGRQAGTGDLAAAAARLAATPPVIDEMRDHFVRLFGHTARGLVCPCETEYGPENGFHQPQQLADIAGYYLAFGLQPAAGTDARVDHIACECEFMDFLNRKEAVLLDAAIRSDEAQETLDATRQAARTFLRDHLALFGCAFAARLANEDRDGCYGAIAWLLLTLLKADCARLGVGTGPTDLVVRPEEAHDVPMACGTADELIQIQRRP